MSRLRNRQNALSAVETHNAPIVIDESKGLVFKNEEELYSHFSKEITFLEEDFFKIRDNTNDIKESDFDKYENHLSELLDDPDEVWMDGKTINDVNLHIYLKEFTEDKGEPIFHVAVVYLTEDTPSFVYLHFPTNDLDLIEKYQRGGLVYDRYMKDAPAGAILGDALMEGDELALGLYEAMLKLRSSSDIVEDEFRNYEHLREVTIEEGDEIWRSNDSMGNTLVSFVKEFPEEKANLHYVVVTLEDAPTNSHALLFSFPTTDETLVARYRHGENLQADEVVQESSH